MKPLAPVFILLALLTACSGTDSDSQAEPSDLLAPQREAMERAEDVEQLLDEAAERRRRLIEEQEGGR